MNHLWKAQIMLATDYLFRKFFIFTLLLSCLACTPTPQTEDFSQAGFQKLFGSEFPITYVKKINEQGSSLHIEYVFKKTDNDQHYVIEIQFAAPDTLLLESDYFPQYQASQSANNPQKHKAEFPAIGLRAQYTFLGAGPGGAADQLIFTSSNHHYDVRIISSQLLPANVATPTLTLETIANYVDKTLTGIQYIKD